MIPKQSIAGLCIGALILASCTFPGGAGGQTTETPGGTAVPAKLATARQKIKHIVIIMQENRSFDEYFGTFPGVDGIPMVDGVPTACMPDPSTKLCVKPYHDSNDLNAGGPHGAVSAQSAIDGGKMDGFVANYRIAQKACKNTTSPGCDPAATPDVMGWHDAREIPNYWMYAKKFVIQDRMFEPVGSWSLPSHLFMLSGWSANCTIPGDPMSCTNSINGPDTNNYAEADYAWTDITYLLHKANVSWIYYLGEGSVADCSQEKLLCESKPQSRNMTGILSPLPGFDTVKEDGQLGNIQTVAKFFIDAKTGNLPSVSWVIPELQVSEHPPASVSNGQAYVTSLINAIMQGPAWDSTVIFIAWDDWGGFYDHVVPPVIDENGYGLRVPAMVISPWVKKGYVDHQTLSFDAYLKFIEDIFLDGQRLDPRTDGRADPRPTVRENVAGLGDLLNDFDFEQNPLPALVLPERPTPGPASIPGT